MNINDYLKISNSQWGRYRVKGYTKVNASKDIVSLFGKQNNESEEVSHLNRYFRMTIATNSFEFGSGIIDSVNLKSGAISNEDYLVLVVKTNIDASLFGNFYLTQSTAVNFKDQTIYKNGNILISKQRLNTSSVDTNSYHFRLSQPTVVPYKIEYAILLNLTDIGLDNLTAQEFYNQYNKFFDKLANGETIPAIMNATSPFNFYKDNELVATYSHPLTLRQGDTFTNTNGKNGVVMGAKKMKDIKWVFYADGIFYATITDIKHDTPKNQIANVLSNSYKSVSYTDLLTLAKDKCIAVNNDWNRIYARDTNFNNAVDYKNHFTDNDVIKYLLATPETNVLPSQMIQSGVTKITDANDVELEFDVLNDNLNFSNKTLVGKTTPTITAEKIISKGFTSAGTHYAQMYIYDDGEVWYVNNGNHATAYANGVWEIEYKTIKFDSGVVLTQEEKETLLKIFN